MRTSYIYYYIAYTTFPDSAGRGGIGKGEERREGDPWLLLFLVPVDL